jgi:hypothetical protein
MYRSEISFQKRVLYTELDTYVLNTIALMKMILASNTGWPQCYMKQWF